MFTRGEGTAALKAMHEQRVDDLYAQIGRLTTQVASQEQRASLDANPTSICVAGDLMVPGPSAISALLLRISLGRG